MGATLPSGDGKGRKKNLNFDLTLTPFIDILAMAICFLLMTAVWIQVGALPVKQSHGTEGGANADAMEIDLRFKANTQIQVTLNKKGRVLQKADLRAASMDSLLPMLDKTLTDWLAKLTPKNAPAGFRPGTLVEAGMVTPKAGVHYGDLVAAMNVLRRHDIVNLGVVPVREN